MLERYLLLHGVLQFIITDHNPKFVSQFWKTYFQALGTKLMPSTAYHPQTDGLSECLNRILEDYLHCFVSPSRKWSQLLALAEFEYNSARQESTQQTPFKLDIGYLPAVPLDQALPKIPNAKAEELITTLDNNQRMAQDALQCAQDNQCAQTNCH